MAATVFRLLQFSFKTSSLTAVSLRYAGKCHPRYLRTAMPCLGIQGTRVQMPSLSPTMTEGQIVKWYKQEGDTINPGDVLCDIQTDKAVVAMEMEEEGILAKILSPEGGTTIPIGTLIALTVEEGEDWTDVDVPGDLVTSQVPSGGDESHQMTSGTVETQLRTGKAMGPAVKSLLEIYGISADDVQATGPHDRLIKGDVLRHIKDHNLKPVPVKPDPFSSTPVTVIDPAPPVMEEAFVDIPHTNMRKTIAKRLTESKVSIPHSYSSIDCKMGNLSDLRKQIIAGGNKVTVNDLIIKVSAVALQRVPAVNAFWDGEQVVRLPNIDVSVAVATESGLITPIVKDAINLSVLDITKAVRDLAGRAKEGKLQLQEFQGGTFTISNLGMYGITEFTAIINPPQSCILAVGTSRLELDSNNKPTTVMTVTLSSDSRIVDEALASKFLETFKDCIENPGFMMPSKEGLNAEEMEAFAF